MGDSETDPNVASPEAEGSRISRRGFLGVAGGAAAGAAAAATGIATLSGGGSAASGLSDRDAVEPFFATHQGGISTTPQSSTYFAALDLDTSDRSEVVDLLRTWTDSAANLTAGRTVDALSTDGGDVEPDSAEILGLGPSRLTVNFGFGPGLFEKNGEDRYGLAGRRPAALVDLPAFFGDELIAGRVGGDITIQACADDPQVAFHAVRQLVRQAAGAASVLWVQSGFNETSASIGTPRNLMGFKDGTVNPAGAQLGEFVWVGSEGPRWMSGGTYVVFRRIRISIDDWDSQTLGAQEQTVGRYKISGAPLGESGEFDALDLEATDSDGNPVIPVDAHVRLSSAQMNNGQMILRRGYAYNDGTVPPVASLPQSEQAPLYDVGIFFCAYQRDPRKGFIPIFQNLAELDGLAQFTIHTASAVAALPPGAPASGSWVGQPLFDS
jgi:deferrochelatase/peroxidase EfeB